MGLAKTVYNEGNIKHMADDIKRDLAEAARTTVNIQAARTMRQSRENIGSNFTIRNNFTKRQVQFTQMLEGNHDLSDIQATVGITENAEYMARQEKGGERTPRRGRTLAIPTNVARGGSNRRLVEKSMRIGKIIRGRVRGKASASRGRKSNFVARAYIAFKYDLFLPMGGRKRQRNFHRVVSFRKRGRDQVEFETEMVQQLDTDRTVTPAQPWLLPATEKWAKLGQQIFNTQCKKRGL